MKFSIEHFGKTSEDEDVMEYTIENRNGTKLTLISYGAAIRGIQMPNGTDVVLGYDRIEDYENQDKYMGATVGRCANRIGGGRFSLNGKEYVLAKNNGPNHLHGGIVGFDKKVWKSSIEGQRVVFRLTSPDGDEGYPGNLDVEISYGLTNNNAVVIDCTAVCDKDTVVNITNHTYFNLAGGGTIEDHYLTINSDEFTEIDETGCSSGKLSHVKGTPFDFTKRKLIGKDIDADCVQIKNASGYDHNYVFKDRHDAEILKAAEAGCGEIAMDVWTDQPGMHFYSGNFLDGEVRGKNGAVYGRRSGFALETQDWPDAVNHEDFPSVVLKKGEVYKRKTVFKFKKMLK